MKIRKTSVMFVVIAAMGSQLALAHPLQERPKLGNGALLKRIFGGERNDSPSPASSRNQKPEADSPDNTPAARAKAKLDEARKQFQADAARMQQQLQKRIAGESPNDAASPASPASAAAPAAPVADTLGDQNDFQSVLESRAALNVANASPPIRSINDRSFSSPAELGPQNQPRPGQNKTNLPAAALDPSNTAARTGALSQGFGVEHSPGFKGQGVQVRRVAPGSIADSLGVQQGDVIKSVAGVELSTIEEIDSLTKILQPEDQFEVFFERNGKTVSKMMSLAGSNRSAPGNATVPILAPETVPELSIPEFGLADAPLPPRQSSLNLEGRPVSSARPGVRSAADPRVEQLQRSVRDQQEIIARLQNQLATLRQQQSEELPQQRPLNRGNSIRAKEPAVEPAPLNLEPAPAVIELELTPPK